MSLGFLMPHYFADFVKGAPTLFLHLLPSGWPHFCFVLRSKPSCYFCYLLLPKKRIRNLVAQNNDFLFLTVLAGQFSAGNHSCIQLVSGLGWEVRESLTPMPRVSVLVGSPPCGLSASRWPDPASSQHVGLRVPRVVKARLLGF